MPSETSRQQTRLLAGLLASIVVSVVTVSASFHETGRDLEERFALRWLFTLRGEIPPPKKVVLVAINSRSAREIFLPEDPLKFHQCRELSIGAPLGEQKALPALPARWPRCLHALLIDRLSAAGARVLVFDVLFRERRPIPIPGKSEDILKDEDTLFANAARRSGRVLIAQKLEIGSDKLLRPAALTNVIEEAVLGAAPFPLPVGRVDRYDRFRSFYEEEWPTVTLSALAVQAYALPAYDRLRTTLLGVAPELDQFAPPSASDVRRSGKLQATAMLFRVSLNEPIPEEKNLGLGEEARADTETRLLQSMLGVYLGPSVRQTNFYGPPGHIPANDYFEVLAMSHDELVTWAQDKIVVVGFQEDELAEQVEYFPTPFTRPGEVGHSGVELLATAIGNLLDNSDIQTAPVSLQMGAMVVFALVVCLAACGLSTAPALAVIFAAASAYLGLAFLAFAQALRWVPLAVPMTAVLALGLGSGVAFRYYEARKQQDRIRSLFVKFVPRGFIDAFERSAESVLFARQSLDCISVATDAAQFTTLAESMTPEALAQLLNRYFERLFEPIAKNEGFVSDIVGDAMLALWPVRGAETRRVACHALLEMHQASNDFSRTAVRGGMQTRFGADLGPVSLGAIGGHEHYEYRAIGDSVNSANRLQELNKKLGTQILVSLPLVEGLDEFLVRDLGTFRLRGKQRPVCVVELLGLRAAADEWRLHLCAAFTLIAHALRNSQLDRARRLLHQCRVDFPDDPPTRFLLNRLARPGALRAGAILTD